MISFSYRKLILFLIIIFAGIGVDAANPKLTASIDSTVIEMGSHATITIDISDPSLKGTLINLPEPGTQTESLDFADIAVDTFPAGYQYHVKIQAFIPGDITFDPFVYVSGKDTVKSSFLSLKVLPVELDSLETINPMESIVDVPRRWYDYIPDWLIPDWPWWVYLIVGFVFLFIIGIILLIIYRKKGTIITRRQKPVDPYLEAITELNNLRERRLAENGHEKEYYTTLVDILRKYLERRFAINAMEMSTTQILAVLNSNSETRNNHPRIKQILELADFVKFAKVRPLPDDNIRSFNNVLNFVEDTKPVPLPQNSDKAKKA